MTRRSLAATLSLRSRCVGFRLTPFAGNTSTYALRVSTFVGTTCILRQANLFVGNTSPSFFRNFQPASVSAPRRSPLAACGSAANRSLTRTAPTSPPRALRTAHSLSDSPAWPIPIVPIRCDARSTKPCAFTICCHFSRKPFIISTCSLRIVRTPTTGHR